MKTLLGKELIVIGTILVVTLVNQNDAAQIRKRRDTESSSDGSDENDLDLDAMLDAINRIPFGIGPSLKGSLNYLGESIILSDQFTNGLISRLLGGSLPCEISIQKGTTCSGLANHGGPYGVAVEVVDSIPEYMLPAVGKDLLLYCIKIGINPFVDFLFGGLPPADN